jgi:hypothetical protein
MLTTTERFENIPGEHFLVACLQKPITFSINNRTIKKGKLLLFKRFHYYIQISISSEKGLRENFDIPFPFKIEAYPLDKLMYFDYRIKSLELENLPKIPDKVSSGFFDKILEIQSI